MTTGDKEFPCPICGSKKRFHKKGCSKKQDIKKTAEKKHVPPVGVGELTCCNQPMVRTDGLTIGSVMCRHNRLLTAECADCRRQHHGALTYRCPVCGRTVVDAPHLAQGHEARQAANYVRRAQ